MLGARAMLRYFCLLGLELGMGREREYFRMRIRFIQVHMNAICAMNYSTTTNITLAVKYRWTGINEKLT